VLEPIVVNDAITVPLRDLSWEATRSSGPGGQNVNKVASKVELRFDLPATGVLSIEVKARLARLAAGRLDADGRILLTSQLTRDQGRNLADACAKLRLLILRALERPKPRRPTRPTLGSRERRITSKKQQSERKQQRRRPDD
jgi:ribosome-associated protein